MSENDAKAVGPRDPLVSTDAHERPVELLQDLIRFETVNPPGNEKACIDWIGELLEAYGIDYATYARDPERPNLTATVSGGDGSPLLLYGHVDVVPVAGQDWTHDPFEGIIEDSHVWGRGTLDMKSGVAMFLATFLRLAAEDEQPPGDVHLLAVSDEEAGGDDGLGYLVDEHPELFTDIDHAIGEFGGFNLDLAGVDTYPIQVNEKQVCWLEATFRGNSGHASFPHEKTAMGQMASFVETVDRERLPVHITSSAEEMFESLADAVPPEQAEQFQALLDPEQTDNVLDAMDVETKMFDALLHNTANPTIVEGGDKENVVPEEVTVFLDCRLVPGQKPEDVIQELRGLTNSDPEFEVVRFDPGPPAADLEMFEEFGEILEAETGGVSIPLLMAGATDGRHLAQVGVQSYGFIPMQLDELPFLDLVHSGDERVPVETIKWGTERVYEAVHEYEG
ncbi:M20/M25/M40 family metallo-hydrolase [Halovenus rubra]|uniref:M20/M25/M40 family metallo-hydrolase n=2 Tax=Halovenus rubra TaxID=869890 RepID=A0ACC7DZG2_9EURY|nr:M20/M25/M40 family metallo-hydrolase [Halovenus rubra]